MKKHRSRKRLFVIIAAITAAAAVTVYVTVEQRANELLAETADARIKAKITGLANECVLDVVAQNADFMDLIKVETNTEGVVSYVKANSVKMNALAHSTSKEMQKKLDELSEQSIYIKWTALFGSDLFSGMGPSVGIQVQPIGNVETAYISEFASAGINQTRHRIYLEIKNDIAVVMPGGSKRVEVRTQIVVSECIVVGVVPNSYVYVDDTDKMLNLIPD